MATLFSSKLNLSNIVLPLSLNFSRSDFASFLIESLRCRVVYTCRNRLARHSETIVRPGALPQNHDFCFALL